jgi:hypothetical protein
VPSANEIASGMRGPFRYVAVLLVALGAVALPAGAQLTRNIGVSIDQCENQPSGIGDCTGQAWISGDLNAQHSLYREGDFVPFRAVITGLTSGTHTLRIGYDAVESGLHAYDYLGSVDGSEKAPGQEVVPCDNVAGTAGDHACGSAPSTLPVRIDGDTTFPSGAQVPGSFSAWGGTLTGDAYVSPTPIDVNTTGTIERQIDVTFVAEGGTVVLAWGGHIASNLDWGPGNTFVSNRSGAPFHMRVLPNESITPGHQDLSLHGDVIAPLPSPFETVVTPQLVSVGGTVVDTATLVAQATGSVSFYVCFDASSAPDCSTGGEAVGLDHVVALPPPGSTGSASAVFVPEAEGHYCFRAEYSPDSVAPYSPGSHTNTDTECFVARVAAATLTVKKVCSPTTDGGRFNLTIDGAVVLRDARCGEASDPKPLSPGTRHTVGETAGTGTSLDDYTITIGANCAADGSITLHAGETDTCTVTNERKQTPPPPTGTLKVTKNCSPASDRGHFDISVGDTLFADVQCGGSTGELKLPAGKHVVREAAGTGTSLADYTTVIGGDCTADGAITLGAGASAACTITNTRRRLPPATVTVQKLCQPTDDPGRFDLTIDGAVVKGNVGCGGTTGAVTVRPGLRRVGESGAGDTDVGDYTVVIGGNCNLTGAVFVEAGEAVTCQITNVRKPPPPSATLTVNKICVPENDGGRFELRIDGETARDQPCGGKLGPLVVAPGVHHVGESAGSSTNLADYTTVIGGDCATDGAITLAAGQFASCTITNIRSAPPPTPPTTPPTPKPPPVPEEPTGTITVTTLCVPADADSRFNVELDQQSYSDLACGDSTGPMVVPAGTHAVGDAVTPQADPARYRVVYRGHCTRHGIVHVKPDAHAHCVVVHIRRRLQTSPSPPKACYTLLARPRTIRAGRPTAIVVRVTIRGKPVRFARVELAGHRLLTRALTGADGHARFALRRARPGVIVVSIQRQYGCPPVPPRRIGVIAAQTPPVTG